jgi:hypothetical protein
MQVDLGWCCVADDWVMKALVEGPAAHGVSWRKWAVLNVIRLQQHVQGR